MDSCCYPLDVAPLRGCWLARTRALESPLTFALNHTFIKITGSDSDNMAATVEEREEQEHDNGGDKENVMLGLVCVPVIVDN